ncbi:MAG: hypothetical protein ABIJ40_20920 [Bacteroidota bacterium]
MITDIEKKFKLLRPIHKKHIDRLWKYYLTTTKENREYIEKYVNTLLIRNFGSHFDDKNVLLPPSPASDGEFKLGISMYGNVPVGEIGINRIDFIKQIGIFSMTGGGKTNLSHLLALQLLKKDIPFLTIDWKRSWRSTISLTEKIPELKKLEIYTVGRSTVPFLWNPMRPPPGVSFENWTSIIAKVLEKSHLGGAGVADYFNRTFNKIFKQRKEDNKGGFPNFFDARKELETITPKGRKMLWKQSLDRIVNDFCFGTSIMSFNTRNPIKIEDLLSKPVILELDQEMPEALRIFLTETLIRWIHLYRLSQGESDELKHILFLEESHNLFSKSKMANESSNSLELVFREIRGFGEGIVTITQHPSLLPIYVLGNCSTQIFLPLQHNDDIEAARKTLFLPYENAHYLDLIETGEAIIKVKSRIKPCHIKIIYVPIKKGVITDQFLQSRHQNLVGDWKISQLSDSTNSSPKKGFPEETYQICRLPEKDIYKRYLTSIATNPLLTITERNTSLSISVSKAYEIIKSFQNSGLINSQTINIKKSRRRLLYLTPKTKYLLDQNNISYKKYEGSIEHYFWLQKAINHYSKKDFSPTSPHTLKTGKIIDCLLTNNDGKKALQIETGKSNLEASIETANDAIKEGINEVIFISTNKETENKLKKLTKETNRITTINLINQ